MKDWTAKGNAAPRWKALQPPSAKALACYQEVLEVTKRLKEAVEECEKDDYLPLMPFTPRVRHKGPQLDFITPKWIRKTWRRRGQSRQLLWDVAEWLFVNRAYILDRIISLLTLLSFVFVVYSIYGTYVNFSGHNLGVMIGSSAWDLLMGAVDLFFGTAVGIGQGAGELSWQAAAQSAKFTVETVEEATGSETLGSLVAAGLGAGIIFLLSGALD